MSRYLITGGAGYIGSHLLAYLLERGHHCAVIDNLSTGHLDAVLGGDFHKCEISDLKKVKEILSQGWDAVFHFASKSVVSESMDDPFLYFHENSVNGLNFIQACGEAGIKKFVLSSTAALFGNPLLVPIPDDALVAPLSPYGDSKYFLERVLHWAQKQYGMQYACLRYFNAAGCDAQGRLGEDHTPETHLIPIVVDTALSYRDHISVFGNDYKTHDGTCVRDYIDVLDLAEYHFKILAHMDQMSFKFNLGNGNGYSVGEIIKTVENLVGYKISVNYEERRQGDPDILVASSRKVQELLGFKPLVNLEQMLSNVLRWRMENPTGYKKSLVGLPHRAYACEAGE